MVGAAAAEERRGGLRLLLRQLLALPFEFLFPSGRCDLKVGLQRNEWDAAGSDCGHVLGQHYAVDVYIGQWPLSGV